LRYRILGVGGPRVSVIGLGLWQAGSRLWKWNSSMVQEFRRALRYAITYGVNFFDTAEVYGNGFSERLLGEILREFEGEDLVVASKVAGYRWTRSSVLKAVEGINRRLGRTVDLIQHHWPPPIYVSICRIVNALEDAVKKGFSSYYGFSNYPASLLEKVYECSRSIEPVSNQVQYNLAYRTPESRLIPFMQKKGLGLIAWSPLAKGGLAGLTKPSSPAQAGDPIARRAMKDHILQDALDKVARRNYASKSQVALAWLIYKGAVPIPGFRRMERVKNYIGAADIRLTPGDVELLDGVTSKYVYNRDYDMLQKLRLVPGLLQAVVIKGMRGI